MAKSNAEHQADWRKRQRAALKECRAKLAAVEAKLRDAEYMRDRYERLVQRLWKRLEFYEGNDPDAELSREYDELMGKREGAGDP